MTDVQDRYIDPNSGAAPQPGGYAGAHALADGHGHVPAGYQLAEDGDYIEPIPAPEVDEAEGEGDGDEVQEFSQQEASEAKSLETQAINSEQGEGEGAEPFPAAEGELGDFTDKEAADAKALELQAIDPSASSYDSLLSQGTKEVQAYLKDHPDERDAVVAAERDRAAAAEKNPRKGIVGDD